MIHEDDSQLYRRPRKLNLILGGGELAAPDLLVKDGRFVCWKLNGEGAYTGIYQGSICLLVENALFSGDTLFAGSIGRTDFPGGSVADLFIKEKLLVLPPFIPPCPQTTITLKSP